MDRFVRMVRIVFDDFFDGFQSMYYDSDSFPFSKFGYKCKKLRNPMSVQIELYITVWTVRGKLRVWEDLTICTMEIEGVNDFDRFRQKLEALYNFWDIMRYENVVRRCALMAKDMSPELRKKMGRLYNQDREKHHSFRFRYPSDFGRCEKEPAWPSWH